MEHWQLLMKNGNECFHEKHWTQAEFFYSEAYDLLAFSYRNNPTCAETLMAWVCACHNLSTLYESIDNLTLSLRFLMVPHDYLLKIIASPMDNEDVKLVALKGLNITLPPIMMFSKKYPTCDECFDKLTSLKCLLNQPAEIVH